MKQCIAHLVGLLGFIARSHSAEVSSMDHGSSSALELVTHSQAFEGDDSAQESHKTKSDALLKRSDDEDDDWKNRRQRDRSPLRTRRQEELWEERMYDREQRGWLEEIIRLGEGMLGEPRPPANNRQPPHQQTGGNVYPPDDWKNQRSHNRPPLRLPYSTPEREEADRIVEEFIASQLAEVEKNNQVPPEETTNVHAPQDPTPALDDEEADRIFDEFYQQHVAELQDNDQVPQDEPRNAHPAHGPIHAGLDSVLNIDGHPRVVSIAGHPRIIPPPGRESVVGEEPARQIEASNDDQMSEETVGGNIASPSASPTPSPPQPEEGIRMVEDSLWSNRPTGMAGMMEYPSQTDLNDLIDELPLFFSRFKLQHVVPTYRMDILFGPNDKYTCRVAWFNSENLPYPYDPHRPGVPVPPLYIVDPGDYLVNDAFPRQWAKTSTTCPDPTRPHPNIEDYNPRVRPTLLNYLEMRLLSTLQDGKKGAWSMGGLFRTMDGRFAFGYRVYLSQLPIPQERTANNQVFRSDPKDKIIRKLGSVLYADEREYTGIADRERRAREMRPRRGYRRRLIGERLEP